MKAKRLLDRLFGLGRNATTVKTELAAGLTTFMTMAYILAVNPQILSAAGTRPNRRPSASPVSCH